MIISASRRTDIPAFYSDWFLSRIREGFAMVRNPLYPKNITKVSLQPDHIDGIVFWTKNPQPMIEKLKELDERGYFYYFLYTITAYGKDLEPNIISKEELIKTFLHLSELVGPQRIIWRYDPIILTDTIDENYHVDNFYNLASLLRGITSKCITSFMVGYKKCIRNMDSIKLEHPDLSKKSSILTSLKQVASHFNIELSICADDDQFDDIKPSCCIDPEIIKLFSEKKPENKKDTSQRIKCNCTESIDIGAYNTCMHHCIYCYANYDSNKVNETVTAHHVNSPMIVGELFGNELIREK
jgi:hypothetical protein